MTDARFEQAAAESRQRIQQACEEFRTRWNSNSPMMIEEFLQAWPDASDEELLARLIQCEIELRRQGGDDPQADEYMARFDGLAPDVLDDLVALPPPPPPRMDLPQLPPRYRLGEEVGRGGIGSVWRVQDTLLGRPLAAKVLLGGYRGDPAANARLVREALLTGSLQHPGIPPIYDRGELRPGSCFFTMKLVEGETLAEMLGRRESSDTDRMRFLSIFEQIAQTVAYAHSQEIIHRDLKPQNVMVGRFGEVQIMDWGMGKRLGAELPAVTASYQSTDVASENVKPSAVDTSLRSVDSSLAEPPRSLTHHGDVLGTPAYMPPEQARGELDKMSPRSDVFSLGAILYEILTARRLYDEVPGSEILEAARDCRVATSLVHLQRPGIDEELARLCRTCLAPQPADRPADAQRVAEATSGYLASVEERLQLAELDRTAAEVKAAEERKRRQIVLGLAAAIVLVSILGCVGVSWQWSNAVNSASRARAETERASNNFDRLLQAVDRMLTRVGDEDLDQLPYMKTVRRDLLQDALEFYQMILAQEGGSAAIDLEVAEAHRRMGKIEYLLGEYEKARQHNLDALARLANLDESTPFTALATSRAECLESVGRIDKRLGDLPASQASYQQAVQLRRELASSRDADQVIHLADSLRGLGMVQRNLDDHSAAEESLLEATSELNRLLDHEPDHAEAWLALAACYQAQGSLADDRSEFDKSLAYYEQAVGVLTPRVGSDEGRDEEIRAELSRYLNNMALIQRKMGDRDGAETSHGKAIKLRKELAQQFPSTPEYRNLLAGSYINLGVVYKQSERVAEAQQLYASAIELLTSLSQEFPGVPEYRRSLGITLHNTANYLEVTVRNEQAVEYRDQAIALFEMLVSETPARPGDLYLLGHSYHDLAIQLERRGFTARALAVIGKAIDVRRGLAESAPERGSYQMTLAASLGLRGWLLSMAPEKELRDVGESLILTGTAVAMTPEPANQRAYGASLYRAERYEEAIDALMAAQPEQSNDLAVCYLLAMAHGKAGDFETAADWFQRAELISETESRLPDVNLQPIRREARDMLEANACSGTAL